MVSTSGFNGGWSKSALAFYYSELPVLVTGGCGFIGSNLVRALVDLGARVSIIDALISGCGWHHGNLTGVAQHVYLSHADLHDIDVVRQAVTGQHVIFNLAGEISHLTSMSNPQRDLSINASAQLALLDQIRLHNPQATVVFASSRQVYGSARYLPVDELHPISPVDYNGVHKLTAEGYHALLRHQFGVNAICLRLGNVYGPRQGIHQEGRGFIDTFLRMVLKGEQLKVFGDGRQMRGMLYVDDAVEAFLRAAAAGTCASAVYNIGHPVPVSLIDVARQMAASCHAPEPVEVPFPCDRKAIDIGDFFQNTERARSELGWVPQVSFAEGLQKTLEFFKPRIAERLHAGTP